MKKILTALLLLVSASAFTQANTKAIFALTPKVNNAEISATTTDRSGRTTTNLKTLVTGRTNGSMITWLSFQADTSSQAGVLLVFISDSTGSNPRLFKEYLVSAATPSTTAVGETKTYWLNAALKNGQQIQVGITTLTGTRFQVWAQSGDF